MQQRECRSLMEIFVIFFMGILAGIVFQSAQSAVALSLQRRNAPWSDEKSKNKHHKKRVKWWNDETLLTGQYRCTVSHRRRTLSLFRRFHPHRLRWSCQVDFHVWTPVDCCLSHSTMHCNPRRMRHCAGNLRREKRCEQNFFNIIEQQHRAAMYGIRDEENELWK